MIKFTDVGAMKLFDSSAWANQEQFIQVSASGATSQSQRLKSLVPWLAKATDMTANAVSELPFDIKRDGGEVFDSSDDWKDKLGGIPSPGALFYKLAASLCTGKAYLIPTITNRQIVGLQYCAPHTIRENITSEGLQSFQRNTDQGKSELYQPFTDGKAKEMMYFWLPDSDVEIGPALTSPASTALLSASMLVSMDSTIQTIAGRGFISPTVMMAKGMANQDARKEAETWWNRFIRGWTTSIAKILNGEAMTMQKVGASMDELRGIYPELSKQAIENIGTAYGIPAALFMSDMAFASEVNPMIKIWYTTSVFIKIYKTIEETFNSQLLKRFKLLLQFRPETLPAFQKDEGARATTYQVYINAGIKPSIAAEMVGLELPDGVEFVDLDPEPVPDALTPFAGQDNQPAQETEYTEDETPPALRSLDAAQIKDLDLWRQLAVRNFKKGKGAAVDFKCKALPMEIADGIRARLTVAESDEDVIKAFEIAPVTVDTTNQLKRALDWLESHDKEVR